MHIFRNSRFGCGLTKEQCKTDLKLSKEAKKLIKLQEKRAKKK